MTAQTATDLRAIRERLVTHGWTQNEQRSADGRCCILGALSAHLPFGEVHHDAPAPYTIRRQDVRRSLWRHLPPMVEISAFNDAPGRTFAEVLDLLDRAIAAEEARP